VIESGSKTAEKNSAQTNRETDRHYENNGHLAVNQQCHIKNTKLVHGPLMSGLLRLGVTLRATCWVAAWRSGNGFGLISEVTLRRARLVLGWVTVFVGQTTSLFH